MNLIRSDPHPFGQTLIGVIHGLPGPGGNREGMVGLDLGAAIEPGQPIDDLAARIRPAGVLKMPPPGQTVVAKGRKLTSGVLNVEGNQDDLQCDPKCLGLPKSG